MTTVGQSTPNFSTTSRGHPALRAAVILGLCGSLVAGFLASSSKISATSTAARQSPSVACDASAAARHAC